MSKGLVQRILESGGLGHCITEHEFKAPNRSNMPCRCIAVKGTLSEVLPRFYRGACVMNTDIGTRLCIEDALRDMVVDGDYVCFVGNEYTPEE